MPASATVIELEPLALLLEAAAHNFGIGTRSLAGLVGEDAVVACKQWPRSPVFAKVHCL
jgi:hypothetical protein